MTHATHEKLPELSGLFPPEVATAVAVPGEITGRLFDVESAAVARAIPSRRHEFVAGRFCARRAIARLGFAEAPIPRGVDRRPVWPPGVVGSISHTTGICGAAVARREDCVAVGLDIEIADACEARLESRVLTAGERRQLAALGPRADARIWRTLFFSVKECVYKALSTIANVREFDDVEVLLKPEAAAFEATIRDGRRLSGKFQHSNGWVLTGAVARAGDFEIEKPEPSELGA